MAGLISPPIATPTPNEKWTTAQSRAQFAALAKLRWCIFRNAFRRKGGGGEFAARIILFPIVGIIAIGPIIGSGIGAYFLVSSGRLAMFPVLTWALFGLWMLVVLNISPPGLSFDINTIIRFPLSFPRYLIARLFFGLLSASNVIGTLSLISAAIGVAIAKPSLAPWSTLVLASYALANIFFVRMVLVWVERWLSTRRARELFTAFILAGSLGFQYINLHFNPGMQGHHHHYQTSSHLPLLLKIFHHFVQPAAALLPPGLTASSIISADQGHLLTAIGALIGLVAFGTLFFSVYSWRMHREFRGENLSEVTQPNQPRSHRGTAQTRLTLASNTVPVEATRTTIFGLNNTVIACLQKEFIYLRRNINQLYGFIVPIFMVFLFAGRMTASERFGSFVFPVAVAYSIFGVSVLAYNALGMDGAGVQFYFLSPTRVRDVFLAKNLMGFLLSLIELVVIFAVISFIAHPPPVVITLATTGWLLFTAFVNSTVGNLRSLMAPKKIDLSKVSRKQASQLSILISLGVILACLGIGYAGVFLANNVGRPWLMVPAFMALAIIAFIVYLRVLSRLDTMALDHREDLAEELCKA